MNFLKFLKQTDGKRLRAKRIVVYGIYLLAPVVIAATALSNDRIIAKCEEIQRENFACAEKLGNCGSTTLQGEVSRLKAENKKLNDLLDNISVPGSAPTTSNDSELKRLRNSVEDYTKRNKDLQASLEKVKAELSLALLPRKPSVSSLGTKDSLDYYINQYTRDQKEIRDLNRTIDQRQRECKAKYESQRREYTTLKNSYDALKIKCDALQNSQNVRSGVGENQSGRRSTSERINDFSKKLEGVFGQKIKYEFVKGLPTGNTAKTISLNGQVLLLEIRGKSIYIAN